MSDKPTINIKFPSLLGSPLFLVFLVLKLTNHIDWSWWWVTAPLWIPLCILVVLLGFMLAVGVLAAVLK